MRRGLSGWLQWFGISSGALWVVVLCGVWWVLCVVVARVPALQMFPQEQPSRPQYHLPCRPSTACRHRTRPPNTRGSVGSCGGSCGGGGSAPATWVLRGPAHCCWPLWWACVWVFRWCPTLPLPGGGSTIGAGGLSFRVRYGSGRFPAPLWPPGRWWGCGAARGWVPPLVGGVGGLVLGCVVDAVGSPGACRLNRLPPLVWGGCVGCVRVGRLVPVG